MSMKKPKIGRNGNKNLREKIIEKKKLFMNFERKFTRFIQLRAKLEIQNLLRLDIKKNHRKYGGIIQTGKAKKKNQKKFFYGKW